MIKKVLKNLVHITSATLIGGLLASNLTSYSLLLTPKVAFAAASYSTGFSVDKAQAAQGETVTYSLTLTNNGDATLTNFNIYQITRPQNTSYVNGSGVRIRDGNSVNIPDAWFSDPVGTNLGDLNVGQAFTFKWAVTVDANAVQTSTITESVAVKTLELGDPNIYPINFTVAINASRSSICSQKTVDKTSASVGEVVTYTIKVCNDGDIDQTNVLVFDRVPKELTYVNGSTVLNARGANINVDDKWAGTSTTDGNGINLGTIKSGETFTVTYKATLNNNAGDGQKIENTAQTKSDQLPNWKQCAVIFTAKVPAVVCTGSIGDFVWNDQNGNGIQDSGEPGISGVTLTLKNSSGTVLATTVTDSNGVYHFNNICAGTYTVEVSGPSGYTPTSTNAGGSTTSNDSNPSPTTVVLTVNNSVDNTIDFGFKQNSTNVNANCSVTKKIRLPNGNEVTSVSASDHIYVPGEEIVYRLFVSNSGNGDANNFSISDFLPTYIFWTTGDGGYSSGDNKVNFDLGTLKANESRTLTYKAKVRDNIPSGQVNQTNNAKVTSPSNLTCTSSSTLTIGKPGAILAATALPQTGAVPTSVLATLGLVLTGIVARMRKFKTTKYWGK